MYENVRCLLDAGASWPFVFDTKLYLNGKAYDMPHTQLPSKMLGLSLGAQRRAKGCFEPPKKLSERNLSRKGCDNALIKLRLGNWYRLSAFNAQERSLQVLQGCGDWQ